MICCLLPSFNEKTHKHSSWCADELRIETPPLQHSLCMCNVLNMLRTQICVWKTKVPDLTKLKLSQRKSKRPGIAATCAHEGDAQAECWGKIQNYLEEKLGRASRAKEWRDGKMLMCLKSEKWIRAAITWMLAGPQMGTVCDSGRLQIKSHLRSREAGSYQHLKLRNDYSEFLLENSDKN